jgi:hypothetical protein
VKLKDLQNLSGTLSLVLISIQHVGWVELFAKPISVIVASDGFREGLNPSYGSISTADKKADNGAGTGSDVIGVG